MNQERDGWSVAGEGLFPALFQAPLRCGVGTGLMWWWVDHLGESNDMVKMSVNVRQFNAALAEYRRTTKRSWPDIVNQRTLSIAGRALEGVRTGPVREQRAKLKEHFTQLVDDRRAWISKKRRAGRKIPLAQVIALAIRKRKGGEPMTEKEQRKAAVGLRRRVMASAGFLKALFVPVIRVLNSRVQFKFPYAKRKGLVFWSFNGAGKAATRPAAAGESPKAGAEFRIGANFRVGGKDGVMERQERQALDRAFGQEAAELAKHVMEKARAAARRQGVKTKG